MSGDWSAFDKDCKAWGIALSDRQKTRFADYTELLMRRNREFNLTAITSFDEILKKHLTDSLALLFVPAADGGGRPLLSQKSEACLMDIGTGAGFPGIPLKIACPGLKVTLTETLHKRVVFLEEVIEALSLKEEGQIEAIHARAEDLGRNAAYRAAYDVVTARAVASLNVLAEYALPFLKTGGTFAAYKSTDTDDECREAEEAASILGGAAIRCLDYSLPHSDIARRMVFIGKVSETPEKYPRKAGKALKNPL